MKIFLILSSVLLVSVSAQTIPDPTTDVRKQLAPATAQVEGVAGTTTAVLNNVQDAVNPNTAAGLTSLVNTGLTSSLTSHFDALSLITDTVTSVPDALICAANASTAILNSITNGASNTVNCLLNKVLAVPNLLNQVTDVLKQLEINSVTNTVSLIKSCVSKPVLTLDVPGALACTDEITKSALKAITALLTTIVAVLGQAINLVLSLVSCAITALATVVGIAGSALCIAVKCLYEIALIDFILPPLNNIIPDFNGVIQAAINLIRQLEPLLQQIQTLIASLTTDLNALIKKVSSLSAQVIQNTLENAASRALGLINHAHTLHLVGPALTCASTAKQNAIALVQNEVQTVLSCAGSIANIAHAALGEVTSYATHVVTNSVSAGLPLVVQCATSALSLSISAVTSCTDRIVSRLTQFVTITLNRLKALVIQVQKLVAAVDQCVDDATGVLIQKLEAVVNTVRSCLRGVGVII